MLQNSQENNSVGVSFLIKLEALDFNFIKKDSYRCFPVNCVKRLRTSFLQNTSQQVLLPNDFLSSGNYQQTKGTKFRDDH